VESVEENLVQFVVTGSYYLSCVIPSRFLTRRDRTVEEYGSLSIDISAPNKLRGFIEGELLSEPCTAHSRRRRGSTLSCHLNVTGRLDEESKEARPDVELPPQRHGQVG
jgi:hypothetical protein